MRAQPPAHPAPELSALRLTAAATGTDADRSYAWAKAQADKRDKLDTAEAVEKGYFESYFETIKQNLKVNVNNVTVVLELDDWERAAAGGRAGVPGFRIRCTVAGAKLETCTQAPDGRWEPAFIDKQTLQQEPPEKRKHRKQITLSRIGVRMCDKPPDKGLEVPEHVEEEPGTYGAKVVEDLNVRVRVIVRQKTNEEADAGEMLEPELQWHLESSTCDLSFNKFQYASLMNFKLQDPWKPDELRVLLHPTVGGSQLSQQLARPRRGHSARQWWRFAISVVMHSAAVSLRQNTGKISWKYFCDLVLRGRPYMRAWKQKLRKVGWSDAETQTARLTEGYRAEDMLGGNKHWIPGCLTAADILYFRELAQAEIDAENERDGTLRSALKGLSPRPAKPEVSVKDVKEKAMSRFAGFKAQAKQKAQEMADKAHELAMIGIDEEVTGDVPAPERVWTDEASIGDDSSGVLISEIKVGVRYYADSGMRVVKTSQDEPPTLTRARPPPTVADRAEPMPSVGALPDAGASSPCPDAGGARPDVLMSRVRGTAQLSREERIELYRKKGIFSDGQENELSSLATNPEYVRTEMIVELGKFSIRLLASTSGDPDGTTPFAALNIAGVWLRAKFRPDSIRLMGRIMGSFSLEARPVANSGPGTKLLTLQRPSSAPAREPLCQFNVDTLTHQTEVSARVAVMVAPLVVHAVPAPIADLIEFFAPQQLPTADGGGADETASARSLKKKSNQLWGQAKKMTKKLGAGSQKGRSDLKIAAAQRKSHVDLAQFQVASVELVVPEEAGNSGGKFQFKIEKLELDSAEHPILQEGMFDRSCAGVKASIDTNTRALETARSNNWCQNISARLAGVSLSYFAQPSAKEDERVCLIHPFSVALHLAFAQQATLSGSPENYLAAAVAVPSITIDAAPDHLARLVRLWESSILPMLPKRKPRNAVTPHPLKELPHEDLDSFVGMHSRATVRLWATIGATTVEGEAPTGICLRLPAASGLAGVMATVPKVSVGLLKTENFRTDAAQAQDPDLQPKDTYIEANVESVDVSFIGEDKEAIGPALISVASRPGSAELALRFTSASQLGWQPGADAWPISVSDGRAWQCGQSVFKLSDVTLANCVVHASLDSVKALKGISDAFAAQRAGMPTPDATNRMVDPPTHQLTTVRVARFSLNCQLNDADTPDAESSLACMALSDIKLNLEATLEPLTSECEREAALSIDSVHATLSQDGSDLELVPDIRDGQPKVKLKFADSTPPHVEEGVPLEPVAASEPLLEQQFRPLLLEMEVHAIMVWIYPSLIRVLYELQAPLASSKPEALDQKLEAAKSTAKKPMEIYVNLSDCDVLLSTTDPTTSSGLATQLVVGVHLQSLLIPPTTVGLESDVEQSFELSIGDDTGGLRIYTGRLGASGVTSTRNLLDDVVLELQLEGGRDGYALNLECGPINANLDGREATALLGLQVLPKLWSSGEQTDAPDDLEEIGSEEEEDEMLELSQAGYHFANSPPPGPSSPGAEKPRIKFVKGSLAIPSIRLALSTAGNDIMALMVQSIRAEIDQDSVEASVYAIAFADCSASEQGLCVLGMGPWAELRNEPTMDDGVDDVEERAAGEQAVQLSWISRPVSETANPLDGDDAGEMVDAELGPVRVRLTPQFVKLGVDWAATVWEDREVIEEEEVAADTRPPEAEEGDWVLRQDYCMETVVYLGTDGSAEGSGGMKRHNRLFVERPAGVSHKCVTISGGTLSVSIDPQAGQTYGYSQALVYVAADVNLVLQDVNVDSLDASLFSLGPGATVSGSMNLDGTEIWDSGLSAARLKARRRRKRKAGGASVLKATIQAHEVQVTSAHTFGSFTFEFEMSSVYCVQDHHTRVEVEGRRISLLSLGVEETSTQLFYMDQATVSFDTSSDDGRAFVQAELGPMPVVLSNKIGQAAFWSANQWISVGQSATSLASELQKAEPKEVRKERLELERRRRQDSSRATLITNVQCPEIEILMLNDTSSAENGGKQLAMRLNIQNVSADSHRIFMPSADDDDDGHMHNQGKVEFEMLLDVMNPNNAAWEPLVEKFPLQLDANRDGPREVVVDVQIGSKAEAITSLHDVPRHGSVEVSLTAPMLDVFQQTSDYWIRSLSETPPPDAADAHCLASQQFASGQEQVTELCSDLNLHNDLPQFQLQYRCGPAFQSAHPSESQTLAAGQHELLNLKYASNSDERYIQMTMDGYSTEKLQVERVMTQVISFKAKDAIQSSDSRVVVSVVHNVGNRKIISIRSPVFVSNKCNEDICMQLLGADGETATHIPAGEGVSLPPTSKSMKIRPAREGMEGVYGWSNVLWRAPIDVALQKIVKCDAAPGAGIIPHNYSIQRTVEGSRGNDAGLTIEVFAPIVVANLLPGRLSYTVYQNSATAVRLLDGALEQGSEIVLYTVPDGAFIEFTLDGFTTSKRHKLPSLGEMPAQVDLPDRDGHVLELQMQAEETSRAGQMITVWCPFWVVNYTGLRLRYAADETFSYQSFAGPAASDAPGEPFLVSQTKMAVQASAVEGMVVTSREPPGDNCAALTVAGERDYETGWSKAFSTGSVGTAGVFSLADKRDNCWRFDIGTNIHLGAGKFRRTKVVVLHAQYTVVNQLSVPVQVRQLEADLPHSVTVAPGSTIPLYWPHRDRKPHIVMRIDADGHTWSNALAYASSHNLGLNLYRRSSEQLAGQRPYVVRSKSLSLRESADKSSPRVAELTSGQVVKRLAVDGARIEVCCVHPDGAEQTGWADQTTSSGNPTVEEIDTSMIERATSHSGFLEKMGEKNTSFRKRFFILSWPKLQYFETKGGVDKGFIDLRRVHAVQSAPKKKVLSLVTASRTYQLKCSSGKEFDLWKKLLLCAIIRLDDERIEVTADLVVDGGYQKLTVAPADPLAPAYIIQNHVDHLCAYVSQKEVSDEPELLVGPNQSRAWLWQDPVSEQRATFRLQDTRLGEEAEVEKDYSLDKIKEHKPVTVGAEELVFIVNVRGLTKVCHIYSKRRKPGVTHSRTARRNSLDLGQSTRTNSAMPKEFIAEVGEMKVSVTFPQIGIALVGQRLMGSDWLALGLNTDIVYLSVMDLEVKLAQQMNGEQSLEVVAEKIQIDNGNRTAPFPVAFRAVPTDGPQKPLFQFSVVKCAKEMGPNAFRMIQVLLQEADVVVDEELVAALMMFSSSVKFGDEDDWDSTQHADDFALSITGGSKDSLVKAETIFCEFLQIHPIKLSITYASSAGISMEELGVSSFLSNNPLLDVLANVDAAPLRLNALVLQDLVTTKDQAAELVVKHYKRQGVTELYKLMGTVDLLGNPLGLVTGVASGVVDFFYEPGQALMTNPLELGNALSKGTMSLIGGTIGGSMNSFSKMTGAVGKGLTTLSMDDSYITQRRSVAQADDAMDGLVSGICRYEISAPWQLLY